MDSIVNNQILSQIHGLKLKVEDFLTKDDIDYYQKLKQTLSSPICRNCRNRRVESFREMLLTIYYFVNRKSEDAWKRSLISGVCWFKNYVCVNIRQMSCLLDKCKSSINGSLQRASLIVLHNKQQTIKILIEAIPYLKNHRNLLMMWSVRQYAQKQQFLVPLMNQNQFFLRNTIPNFSKEFINKERSETSAAPIDSSKLRDITEGIKCEKEIESSQIEINNNNNNNHSRIDPWFNFFGDIDLPEEVSDRYNF